MLNVKTPKSDLVDKVENPDGIITYTKSVNSQDISVTYSKKGYPDFSTYSHPEYSEPVSIKMTRDNVTDFKTANKAIGRTGSKAPSGYTWHHM